MVLIAQCIGKIFGTTCSTCVCVPVCVCDSIRMQTTIATENHRHLPIASVNEPLQQTTISNFAAFFKNNQKGMLFHENRLLTDDSHEVSYLIFVENWEKCHKICRLLQS